MTRLPEELRAHLVKGPEVPPGGRRVAVVEFGDGGEVILRFAPPVASPAPGRLTEAEAAVLADAEVLTATQSEVDRATFLAEEAFEQLRAGSLTVEQAAHRLRVNASRVRQRLIGRSLFGFKDGVGWRLPAFQFARSGGLVPGIEAVLRSLPADIAPVAADRWFRSPNADLSSRTVEHALSPLAWLAQGNPPSVVTELAAAL